MLEMMLEIDDPTLQALNNTIWAQDVRDGRITWVANERPKEVIRGCYEVMRPHIGELVQPEIDRKANDKVLDVLGAIFDFPRYGDILAWNAGA